jgi:hypothetical protein
MPGHCRRTKLVAQARSSSLRAFWPAIRVARPSRTNTELRRKRKRPPRGAWCGGRLMPAGARLAWVGPEIRGPETGSLNTPSRCPQEPQWDHRDVFRLHPEWGEIVISWSDRPAARCGAENTAATFCGQCTKSSFVPGSTGIYSEISRSARAYGPVGLCNDATRIPVRPLSKAANWRLRWLMLLWVGTCPSDSVSQISCRPICWLPRRRSPRVLPVARRGRRP